MSTDAPLTGRSFGRYQLLELVAVSGMGVVYRAWDPRLQCIDAIKLISEDTIPDESARRQLEKEAQIATSLDHPNICRIKNFVDDASQAGIVMEFVEGQVLTNLIPAQVGLAFDQVLLYGIEIARAVACAHDHGVVHRDLKSGNVMVTRDGRIKLLDFGLSKIQSRVELPRSLETSASTHGSGGIAGTPPYMPPEVLRHCPSDARSDVWSLGVLLYEMASGQMPFKGATLIELGIAVLREQPLPLPEHVPESLCKIIHRCLQKEMDQRYQHAGEVLAALEAVEPHGHGPDQPRPMEITGLPPIRSVAVLPLENLSRAPDQEYFADGMTESLITALFKIEDLKVISRTSTMRYKRVEKTLPQIARELNVDAIVEGSVHRDGDRVRITAELIEGRTDHHIWAESYDRDLSNILSLQAQVAATIAREIYTKLKGSNPLGDGPGLNPTERPLGPSFLETIDVENDNLDSSTAVNPKAFDLYLRGRHFWNNQVTDEDFRQAVTHYQRAIEIDPGAALFHSGLAHCLLLMGAGEYSLKAPAEMMTKAKEAALTALRIDESNAEAHLSLAMVKFRFDWDWEGAEKAFKRALELNRGFSPAHGWYSTYLAVSGRFDEAFVHAKTARELSPFSPAMHLSLGLLLYASGQNEEAIEQLRATTILDAKFPLSHLVLGLTFGRKGRFDEAIAEFKTALAIVGTNPLWSGFLGQMYGSLGRTEDAMAILHQLEAASTRRYVPPTALVAVYAGMGKTSDAFHWLAKAIDERDGLLIYLKVGSVFDSLRSDPRFPRILDRVGLPRDPRLVVQHPLLPKPRPKPLLLQPTPWRLQPWRPPLLKLLLGVLVVCVGALVAPSVIRRLWPAPSKMVLAIRPFKALGGDTDAQHVAEIVGEEIFTRVGELHPQQLQVVEVTEGAGLSLEQVCNRAKSAFVLEGAVHRDGQQMIITDQMVACKDQEAVSGDRHAISSDGSGLGPVVDDMVQRALATFAPAESSRSLNPQAYDAYLNGRFEWNRRTTQSLWLAISHFQKAIEFDAGHAPSYAGLADCYALLGTLPYNAIPPNVAFPKAKENAQKALELDPNLAEAYVSLGYAALVYDRNYTEAGNNFKRAIQLRPGYATAHQYYAYYLTAMGNVSEAVAERKLAVSQDSNSPLLNTALGEAYYQARQFQDSLGAYQRALEIDPRYAVAIINLGRAFEQMKMYARARQAYQSILAFAPNDPALLALVGHLDAVSGRPAAARQIISRLQQLGNTQYVPSLYTALVYTGLGDKNQAFAWFGRAEAERCDYLVYLPTDPMADPLRSDPRFPALLERLGLRK